MLPAYPLWVQESLTEKPFSSCGSYIYNHTWMMQEIALKQMKFVVQVFVGALRARKVGDKGVDDAARACVRAAIATLAQMLAAMQLREVRPIPQYIPMAQAGRTEWIDVDVPSDTKTAEYINTFVNWMQCEWINPIVRWIKRPKHLGRLPPLPPQIAAFLAGDFRCKIHKAAMRWQIPTDKPVTVMTINTAVYSKVG